MAALEQITDWAESDVQDVANLVFVQDAHELGSATDFAVLCAGGGLADQQVQQAMATNIVTALMKIMSLTRNNKTQVHVLLSTLLSGDFDKGLRCTGLTDLLHGLKLTADAIRADQEDCEIDGASFGAAFVQATFASLALSFLTVLL
jgi:hypothetical protein